MKSSEPGAGLRLTRKEAQLLAVLRQNPGRCLSRKYLLKVVWGYDGGAVSRTVDAHIWKLRSKLEPGQRACIQTLFRDGYCWQPNAGAADRSDYCGVPPSI